MSFRITVSGHRSFDTAEESAAFEREVADEAAKFVRSVRRLVGPSAKVEASGTFGHIGAIDFPDDPGEG